MKIRKFLLAALLILAGCVPSRYLPERQLPSSKQASVTIDHSVIKKLEGSSAKYSVKRKYSVMAPDGSFSEVIQGVWTGSAFCIGIKRNPQTGIKYSLWATCRHVADSREVTGSFSEIDYRDSSGRLTWARVDSVWLSASNDIAIFTSLAIPQSFLELASAADLDNFSLGDFLLAVGHPSGMFPAGITIGVFLGVSGDDVRFTTSATYGSSGSALVDAQTMKVVGVIYRFAGGKYRGGFRSDDLAAVSVNKLRGLITNLR